VQRRLARAGVSASELMTIDPAATTASALDPIQVLLRP